MLFSSGLLLFLRVYVNSGISATFFVASLSMRTVVRILKQIRQNTFNDHT